MSPHRINGDGCEESPSRCSCPLPYPDFIQASAVDFSVRTRYWVHSHSARALISASHPVNTGVTLRIFTMTQNSYR